ncbi:MAG: DUF1667 domain-containing protein [Clostridia bacterium]|nr:DUF1667 domain-containing protein [Clostridia bacterium]
MDMICIRCPNSCQLHVVKKNGKIVVTGNLCPRGEEYGIQEVTDPRRTITSVKAIKGGTISVRTTVAVQKRIYFDILNAIADAPTKRSYKIGDVLIKNVCGTGSDIIVTGVNIAPKIK